MESKRNNFGKRDGFTLIELLIVIGLLGALATLVLSNLSVTRTDSLDYGIVQKELSDIQRAFQRFEADCAPTQADYELISKYGLAVLMKYDDGSTDNDIDSGDGYLGGGGTPTWSFGKWDSAKGKGWRGPYITQEGVRRITVDSNSYSTSAQPYDSSGTAVPVACTPYVNDDNSQNGSYYRVIPELDGTDIKELYVVAPFDGDDRNGDLPEDVGNPDSYEFKRKLLLN